MLIPTKNINIHITNKILEQESDVKETYSWPQQYQYTRLAKLYKIAKIYNNIKPDELYELNDNIEDEIHLIKPVELQRDKAFIYFNNNIYTGINHATAFNTIKNLNNKQKQLYLKYRFTRKHINTNDKIAFGHIANNNIGVIDSYTNLNCTNDEIKNALLQFGCKKIYAGNTPRFDLKDIIRIAKRDR